MDFPMTEDQVVLVDMIDKVFRENYDYGAAVAARNDGQPWSLGLVTSLLEVGLGGLALPLELGGFGGASAESALLMERAGARGLSEPWLTLVLAAGRLVGAVAPQDEAGDLAAALQTGELPLAVAGLGNETAGLTLAVEGGARRVSGKLANVVGLHRAERLVLLMSTGEVLAIPAAQLDRRPVRRLDGLWGEDLYLSDVQAVSWGCFPDQVLQIRRQAVLDLCWNALGAMAEAAALATAHVRERKQFGRPLFEFQVIQHRLAEMFAHVVEVRAVLHVATASLDEGAGGDIERQVAMAKVRTGRAARYVAREAVQLHGGMGVSDESPAANLFRHLTAFEGQLGTTFEQRRHYGNHVLERGAFRKSVVLPQEG